MNNPFTDTQSGNSMPDMLSGEGVSTSGFNPENYRYRVSRFELGSQDTNDESSALEALLDMSLTDQVYVLERKDSISATTGIYTCIVIYLERRVAPAGGNNA